MAIVINGTGTIAGVSATGITTAPTNATDSTKLPLAGGTMTGNIAHAGDFTIDTGGDILLDADGAEIRLLDAGSDFGKFFNDAAGGDGNFVIKSQNDDKDIIFQGKDGSSTIEAMRIDMSAGGKVGIGTTSPVFPLEVKTTGSTAAQVGISNTGTGEAVLYFDASNGDFSGSDYAWIGQQNDLSLEITTGLLSNAPIIFKTNDATRARIDNDGLKFGSDTAAANALDDYEEGTFTPAASGGASSVAGTYTKVGRLVTCNGTLTFPSQTNSGRATVEGLPFTSLNVDHGFTGTIRYTDYNPRQLMIHGDPNSTGFGLYEVDYGSAVTQTSWTEISGKRFDFNLMYFV
tara:strand:+ start:1183 stop:2220 length:1038 start_codon:yes stop_codon:yes gene_type:complete